MHLENISRSAIKLALYNLESIQNNGAQVELRCAGAVGNYGNSSTTKSAVGCYARDPETVIAKSRPRAKMLYTHRGFGSSRIRPAGGSKARWLQVESTSRFSLLFCA
jgi:hypothetical protein